MNTQSAKSPLRPVATKASDSDNLANIAKTNRLIAGFLIALFILSLFPVVIMIVSYAVALDAAKHLASLAGNSPSSGQALRR
jgi:hypothetical protein